MEWINVKDRMPDTETEVLATLQRDDMKKVEFLYFEDPYFFFDFPSGLSDAEKFGFEVTHWMNVPEPANS